jgi:ribose transport system permease protein
VAKKRVFTSLARALLRQQGLSILIIITVVSTLFVPNFNGRANYVNVIRQGCLLFSFSLAMTLAMIVGGLNLSIGGVGALTGAVAAVFIRDGSIFVGISLGLATGLILGIITGFVIGRFGIPHFIMTYGMMQVGNGLTLNITGGKSIFPFPEAFRQFGIGFIGFIPVPVIVVVIMLLVFAFIMRRTTLGRSIYAVGSNKTAARFSAINVNRMYLYAYGFGGIMASVAGLLFISRMGSAEGIMGQLWPLQAIASSVIGGATFAGGEGSVTQTFFGAMSVAVIYNILNLLGISSAWQQFAVGLIIIASILFNQGKTAVLARTQVRVSVGEQE